MKICLRVLPRLKFSATIFCTLLSATAQAGEILPAEIKQLPGNIQGVYMTGPKQAYVVYDKKQDCPAGSEVCFSYGIVDNQALRISDHWIRGSAGGAQNFHWAKNLPIGPQSEIYLPVIEFFDDKVDSSVFKLTPDVTRPPQPVYTFSSPVEKSYTLKSLTFNQDFTQLYARMLLTGEGDTLLVAKDIDSPPDSYRWSRDFFRPMHTTLFIADNAGGEGYLLTQGGRYNDSYRYLFSASEPDLQTAQPAYFAGDRAISRIEEGKSVAYGMHFRDCGMTKIDLQQAVNDNTHTTDPVVIWSNAAMDCDTNIDRAISLTTQQQRVYALFDQSIYVLDRTTGDLLFRLASPQNTHFIDYLVFDNATDWAYVSFTGTDGAGVLAFSPDGKSQRQYPQAGVKGAPAIVGGSLYSASGNQLYRYNIDVPGVTQWQKIQQIHHSWLSADHYRNGVVIQWTEQNDSKSVSHQVKLDPRDTAEGVLNPYRWPLQFATAINTLSAQLRAGEHPDTAPLASSYRNWIFQPAGHQQPVEFNLLPLDRNMTQVWTLNSHGSALCSYGDLPVGSHIRVTVTGKDAPVSQAFAVNSTNAQRYNWPKYLADFINQNFTGVMAGEKIDDASSLFRQLYSSFRNRLWIQGEKVLSIELPVSTQLAEVADNCRSVP